MHWTIEQIMWALVLAAHLVLLVVLLGRDRRFPWFTAAIALSTARLLADHLLHGKLTTVAFYWQSYSSMLLDSILAIIVLVELARKVFASGKAGLILNLRGWLGWTLVTVALAVASLWLWGPFPTWKALSAEPAQLPLLLVVLSAMKSQLFVAALTIEVALLLRIFGARFGSGWRAHPQQIALGLSTVSIGLLAIQAISESIKRTVHLTSRQEYDRVLHLFQRFDNARSVLWLLVILWWIFWLWRDEPGSPSSQAVAEELVLADLPPLETHASAPEPTDPADAPFTPEPF